MFFSYNFIITLANSGLFALCASLVGIFLVIKREELISDVLAHATLPGVVLGFSLVAFFAESAQNKPVGIFAGAFLTAYLCQKQYYWLEKRTNLSPDLLLAVSLSLWFGLGSMLFSLIQQLPISGQAGLGEYLLGSASAATLQELIWTSIITALVLTIILIIFHPLVMISFDSKQLPALGGNSSIIEKSFGLCVLATIAIGLHTVGLVLVIGLILMPTVIARLWFNKVSHLCLAVSVISLFSVWAGVGLSAAVADLPAGATIILILGALLLVSLAVKKIKYSKSIIH